jgi:hypothetical protein
MELIIEEIVDEICYLSSLGELQGDVYLDELVASMFDYGKS